MEYILLEEKDLEYMLDFVDDENTKYNMTDLKRFIDNKNSFGFIAKLDNIIIGFAYGYILLKPDGKQDFYLHAIDIMTKYQGNGFGTEFMNYIKQKIVEMGCRKMFLITNKSNISACKCYEKSGGIKNADDEVIYVYK